jgi:hypothetical protein
MKPGDIVYWKFVETDLQNRPTGKTAIWFGEITQVENFQGQTLFNVRIDRSILPCARTYIRPDQVLPVNSAAPQTTQLPLF